MRLGLQHTFNDDLPKGVVSWSPDRVPRPVLVFWNDDLARTLGLDVTNDPDVLARTFSGNVLPEDARPVAQAYAGHQFGAFAPRLGDGRALLLGELVDPEGRRFDVALKGSGATPFARGGDGKAALGPMLREVLIGECLHALGVPTTRALAVVTTGENVRRSSLLPGAVLTRVAASHIRVGTFEYFAHRGDIDSVRVLTEHAIGRHHPELMGREGRFEEFARRTVRNQALLLAAWMDLGFIHGVMNTDNMAISGESIDFGPCAFVEGWNPAAVFSSIDTHGRYALGNQPRIAQWNLARLLECLLPLLHPETASAVGIATEILGTFGPKHEGALLNRRRRRLGLPTVGEDHSLLVADWMRLLEVSGVDHTLAWRGLADDADGNRHPLRDGTLPPQVGSFLDWFARWQDRRTASAADLRCVNPRILARNHLIEAALEAASDSLDFGPFERLVTAVRRPFDDGPDDDPLYRSAPEGFTRAYRTCCGT